MGQGTWATFTALFVCCFCLFVVCVGGGVLSHWVFTVWPSYSHLLTPRQELTLAVWASRLGIHTTNTAQNNSNIKFSHRKDKHQTRILFTMEVNGTFRNHRKTCSLVVRGPLLISGKKSLKLQTLHWNNTDVLMRHMWEKVWPKLFLFKCFFKISFGLTFPTGQI